ncbi:hypothetical protein MKX01_040058 [Papaver californicum]|nr:hypothetical protein MKX01_040058 [Papaver californicum]
MITRQVVEAKAKDMEEEISRLQENLDDRNRKLQASACIAQQLENHQRAELELKKRVLKLEFFLQEAHSQTKKLQRMGEKRDKVLEELNNQVDLKQQEEGFSIDKQNFLGSSGFKVMASMAMFVLVAFGKH